MSCYDKLAQHWTNLHFYHIKGQRPQRPKGCSCQSRAAPSLNARHILAHYVVKVSKKLYCYYDLIHKKLLNQVDHSTYAIEFRLFLVYINKLYIYSTIYLM